MINQEKLWDELLNLLTQALTILSDKQEETHEATLLALWWKACGRPLSVVVAAQNKDLPDLVSGQENELRGLVAQRLSGTPLAYLTGRQYFMGFDLLSTSGTLIPRKETELLGESSLGLLRAMAVDQDNLVYIDVCTGAGNLPVALASRVSCVTGYAADISPDSVRLAQQNIDLFNLQERVKVREGDFLEPFESEAFYKKIDLLTCNPPYISSSKVTEMQNEISGHEPGLAFDGGPFGIKILRRLIGEAPKYLKPGGWLAFEVGLGPGKKTVERMKKKYDYRLVRPVLDENGDIRVILAQM